MKIPKEFIKYCLVGMINTLAGISTAYICLNILSQSYLVSTTAAYITGIIVSFTLNKVFTFTNKSKKIALLFFKFVITMLPSYALSYYLGWLLSRLFEKFNFYIAIEKFAGLTFNISEQKVSDNIAIIISMTIYLILGYAINKYIIFTHKKSKP